MRAAWLGWMIVLPGICGVAQTGHALGSVDVADASVTTGAGGMVPVASGRAELMGSSSITAKENRNAVLTLARGGSALVCQTSMLHATPSGDTALLLGLDRGAMELHLRDAAGVVVVTPDMRFTMTGPGAVDGLLDLRMRVTRNGDTCIENRGRKAPTLAIMDAFGEASYEVKPGQHVLFVHGNLREVVDRETTPCGCPPMAKPGVAIADAVLTGGGAKMTPKQAEAAHPFPAAVSDGLAAPGPAPAETPAGGTHVQVAATLTFDAQKEAEAGPDGETLPKRKGGPFRAVGRFFKHVFVR